MASGLNVLAELLLELAMGVLAVDVMGVLSGEGCGVAVGVKDIVPFVTVIDTCARNAPVVASVAMIVPVELVRFDGK